MTTDSDAEMFKRARDYINAATTPEERNKRKLQAHGMVYGAGPKTFMQMFANTKLESKRVFDEATKFINEVKTNEAKKDQS